MNAAVIGGLATAGGKLLSLKMAILPRFLRAVGSAALSVITLLAKQPAKGTTFVFDVDTPKNTVLSAIAIGVTSIAEVLLRISELQYSFEP